MGRAAQSKATAGAEPLSSQDRGRRGGNRPRWLEETAPRLPEETGPGCWTGNRLTEPSKRFICSNVKRTEREIPEEACHLFPLCVSRHHHDGAPQCGGLKQRAFIVSRLWGRGLEAGCWQAWFRASPASGPGRSLALLGMQWPLPSLPPLSHGLLLVCSCLSGPKFPLLIRTQVTGSGPI